jgi:hypothetical protein
MMSFNIYRYKNNLEIIVRELSMETNFNGSEITNEQELLDFAELVQFPSTD